MQTKSVVMIALSAFALGMLCVLPFTTGSENEYAESTFKSASIVRRLDQASRVMEARFDTLEKSMSRLRFEFSSIADANAKMAPVADASFLEELALMRDQLRTAVAMVQRDAEQVTRGREDESVLLIPGNAEAFDESSERVEWAISDGYWSEEDAMELRINLPKLTSSQREQLILSLIPAINSGEVQFDGSMPF